MGIFCPIRTIHRVSSQLAGQFGRGVKIFLSMTYSEDFTEK
jgi:hypothetical protein